MTSRNKPVNSKPVENRSKCVLGLADDKIRTRPAILRRRLAEARPVIGDDAATGHLRQLAWQAAPEIDAAKGVMQQHKGNQR